MNLLADVALPLIFVVAPILTLWFCLVMLFVETAIGVMVLHMPFRRLLAPTFLFNFVSSVVGVPITGIIMAVIAIPAGNPHSTLDYVLIGAGWGFDVPREHLAEVKAGGFLLMFLLFLSSVFAELITARRLMPEIDRGLLRKWIWLANTASYIPVFAFLAISGI